MTSRALRPGEGGLDSTAMLIEWVALGRRLDLVLTADTGTERPETYAYLPIFQRWMDDHGIAHHIFRYTPKRFKHWPPYFTLLENCLTNATLPSISFGRIHAAPSGRPRRRTAGSKPGSLRATRGNAGGG